ncbi:hypothetical protein B0H14DRAFT_2628965 [Mycena olivaceomarginata]|nr:hypothetical protein B0H14DRAFT_2628965 [Mycena olivaceomarginata]
MPLFYITAFVCIVNRPTHHLLTTNHHHRDQCKAKRLEVALSSSTSPLGKSPVGSLATKNPRTTPYDAQTTPPSIHGIFAHFYSDFSPLSHSTVRDLNLDSSPIVRSTATRTTDPFPEPTHRAHPSSSPARENVNGVTSGGREHAFVFHARVSEGEKTEITFFRFRRQGWAKPDEGEAFFYHGFGEFRRSETEHKLALTSNSEMASTDESIPGTC